MDHGEESQFQWTTGRMAGVLHEERIAIGGGGEVHKVLFLRSFR